MLRHNNVLVLCSNAISCHVPPVVSYLSPRVAAISLQPSVMLLWVFKMDELGNPCSPHPPCTITTTVRGAPDYRHETTALHEEVGSPSTTTESSGYKLTWEPRRSCEKFLRKADMTPTNGSPVIPCPLVKRESDFIRTKKEKGQRYDNCISFRPFPSSVSSFLPSFLFFLSFYFIRFSFIIFPSSLVSISPKTIFSIIHLFIHSFFFLFLMFSS